MMFDLPDAEEEIVKETKKRPQKTSEEDFEERLYNKRCQLVKLSKSSDFSKFMEFLRENENVFRKMNDYDKECMRRTCERALGSSYIATMDDAEYCDRIFGPYIDPRHSKRIPSTDNDVRYRERKMSLEEEIAYRSRGSYYAMWSFISDPEWQGRLKGRTDLYDKVKFMIDRAKEENIAISEDFKRYEPSDEEMYVKILELMKE